jgi:hypothetical protein
VIDIVPFVEFIALIAGPVLVARLVTGGEPVDLPSLLATVTAPPGAAGVQEEEPVRWQLDRLGRRHRPAARATIHEECRPGLPRRRASRSIAAP